jgi:hypothetical protein
MVMIGWSAIVTRRWWNRSQLPGLLACEPRGARVIQMIERLREVETELL